MPPTPIPSKVTQDRALRRASDEYTEPLYAQTWLGVDRRDCLFCDATTDRADSICSLHDFYACCGNELVPLDTAGHALGCPTPDRLPYHMEAAVREGPYREPEK